MENIGVYKTNVIDALEAEKILEAIRNQFPGCDSSFDLEDCDKVLRVEDTNKEINEPDIKSILEKYGYQLESML